MSRFITAALILLAGAPVCLSQANGSATYKIGPMWCGAVRRSANTVQTYCLSPGSASQTVENTIRAVSVNFVDPAQYALIVTFQYFYDPNSKAFISVGWSFRIVGTGIDFDFYGCDVQNCQRFTGNFPVVYGTVAKADPCWPQYGAMASGQCRCVQLDNPRGCAIDLSVPWSGVFALSTGQRVTGGISHGCIAWPRSPFPALRSSTQSLCGVTDIGPAGEVMGSGQWLGFWIM